MEDRRDPEPATARLPVLNTGAEKTGISSAARIQDDWYVACTSRELGDATFATTLHGAPIVLFRGSDGGPSAFVDRCPHRNIPLSQGTVVGGQLQCRYHGWRFDGAGACQHVPGLKDEADQRGRRAQTLACREADGVVWVYATADAEPVRDPWKFQFVGRDGYRTFIQSFEVDGTVHAVAENALDVPHTAFVHSGLFRNPGATPELDVVVRRWHDHAEAKYIGEPAPRGIVGRILAPRGGVVEHFDRFWLPSIAEVDYRLGDSHVNVSSAITPLSAGRSRLTAVTCVHLPRFTRLAAAIVKPIARRIFAQDADILAAQARSIESFGGERFVSTDLDLGPQILRLLRNAERGERSPRDDRDEPVEKHFRLKL